MSGVEQARAVPFASGLHDVAEGTFAYLQPDGDVGLSNAGLVVGDRASLLVDTLIDGPRTRRLLEKVAAVAPRAPIEHVIHTHGDGDHWFGNAALPPGTETIATEAAIELMGQLTPATFRGMLEGELPPDVRDFVDRFFTHFDFDADARPPTRTFSRTLELEVGGRTVVVHELGPAHSTSDSVVLVPDAGVLFAGDILFTGVFPVAKASLANSIAILDRILEFEAETFVPGHGPVCGRDGVEECRRYLEHVRDEAATRFDRGMDVRAAADDIDVRPFSWVGPERVVINVIAAYAELDPGYEPPPEVGKLGEVAAYAKRHRLWD